VDPAEAPTSRGFHYAPSPLTAGLRFPTCFAVQTPPATRDGVGFAWLENALGCVSGQSARLRRARCSDVKEQLLEIAKKWRTMAAFEEKHGR
jgi:hypothetical protein